VLTDRGTEYCGNPERHEYEIYLAVEDIDHSRTKTKTLRGHSTGPADRWNLQPLRPQTNGICERFHRTVLDEFYRIALRKNVYRGIEDLQADLDSWVANYNENRPHQGRWCFGKTPMQTSLGAVAKVVESSGGVVSGSLQRAGPAFERRWRPRHGTG
jgi:hypothetical protein